MGHIRWILMVLVWGVWGTAYAQKSKSIFDRLSELPSPLDVDIQVDMAALEDQRNTNEYVPAVFSFRPAKKVVENWNVELRSRGKYRRKICIFPPLKVKFAKPDLKQQGYNSDNEFKLVTHCVEGEAGKEYLLREYLVYKLFEQVSPDLHLKTLLVRVRYTDQSTEERTNGWGILVEDEHALERRFKGDVCDSCFALPLDTFHLDNLRLVYLFQYFAGNTDWNPASMHNVLVMKSKSTGKAVLVPYDFDFSGIVNATYAVPNTTLGQKRVRDRIFMEARISDRDLAQVRALFKDKRGAIEQVIRDFKWLSAASKIDIFEFLAGFYDELDKEVRRPTVQKQE